MTDPRISPQLPDWIKDHLRRYLASNGEDGHLWDATVAGGTGLVPTLVLTTTGRKSGKPLTLPLIYGRAGNSCVVIASKGGAPQHPAWYLNLEANPEVEVQVKAECFRARARTASGAGTCRAVAADGGDLPPVREVPGRDLARDSGGGARPRVSRAPYR